MRLNLKKANKWFEIEEEQLDNDGSRHIKPLQKQNKAMPSCASCYVPPAEVIHKTILDLVLLDIVSDLPSTA